MELLSQLYKIISKSGAEDRMKSFVLDCLKDVPMIVETDEIGNVFITKGVADTYPCVAAHLDEIHAPCQREVVCDGDVVYTVDKLWNRVGCGADDKNGLWVIINLLHSEPVLKVALFVLEERCYGIPGCRGARACDLSFFDNARYIVECDRKGSSDVVCVGKGATHLCDTDFIPQELLLKYRYEMVPGGKTDVVELKMRGLEIPVCNVSCGYYNAHKNSEYTLFSELQKCLNFVKEIIKEIR
jgi:di/tripeptidase